MREGGGSAPVSQNDSLGRAGGQIKIYSYIKLDVRKKERKKLYSPYKYRNSTILKLT